MRLRKQIYVCTAQDTHTQTARAAHNNWKSFFFHFVFHPECFMKYEMLCQKHYPIINQSIFPIFTATVHRAHESFCLFYRWAHIDAGRHHIAESSACHSDTQTYYLCLNDYYFHWCVCVCVCIGGDTAPTINKEWMAGRALPTLSHLLFYTVVLLTRGWLSTDGARHNARAFDTEGRCG